MVEKVMCGCKTYMDLVETNVEMRGMKYDRYRCPDCGAEQFVLKG